MYYLRSFIKDELFLGYFIFGSILDMNIDGFLIVVFSNIDNIEWFKRY